MAWASRACSSPGAATVRSQEAPTSFGRAAHHLHALSARRCATLRQTSTLCALHFPRAVLLDLTLLDGSRSSHHNLTVN